VRIGKGGGQVNRRGRRLRQAGSIAMSAFDGRFVRFAMRQRG
jgi:hypothetical protein